MVSCITEKQPVDHGNEIIERLDDFVPSSKDSITKSRPKRENRDCPDHYYCVAIFDIAKQPNMHQGCLQLNEVLKVQFKAFVVRSPRQRHQFAQLAIHIAPVKHQIMGVMNVHGYC